MDELQEILKGQVRELAGSVLSQPQRSALDRAAQAIRRSLSSVQGD
jgi:hypothetical protein